MFKLKTLILPLFFIINNVFSMGPAYIYFIEITNDDVQKIENSIAKMEENSFTEIDNLTNEYYFYDKYIIISGKDCTNNYPNIAIESKEILSAINTSKLFKSKIIEKLNTTNVHIWAIDYTYKKNNDSPKYLEKNLGIYNYKTAFQSNNKIKFHKYVDNEINSQIVKSLIKLITENDSKMYIYYSKVNSTKANNKNNEGKGQKKCCCC